jgi:hypothetical protein
MGTPAVATLPELVQLRGRAEAMVVGRLTVQQDPVALERLARSQSPSIDGEEIEVTLLMPHSTHSKDKK